MRVAIIGAGPSGVASGILMERLGIRDYVIFEKSAGIGGTWRDNRYPGLTCDVPSHLYRYSFAPNPDWEYEYAPGHEICSYIQRVASEQMSAGELRFNTVITAARFDDAKWQIESPRGSEGVFDAVIAATGILHHSVVPDMPGSNSFSGDMFHASNWPEGYDVRGKRVGVVGTGSTAVQIFPAIIDDVKVGKLFQRTPQWVFPAKNKRIPDAKRELFRSSPTSMADLYAFLGERFNSQFAAAVVGENDDALRQTTLACEENLQTVADPELRRRLTPNYAVGCKRLVVSDKFYPAIQRPNAELVDGGIAQIEANGIRTSNGKLHELDTIVFATGYDPFRFVRPMKVAGRDRVLLDEYWAHAHTAYRSVALPAFPNFFLLGGPNSPIGNFSFIMTVEAQLEYVAQLITLLKDGIYREISPTREATERFNAELRAAIPKTVWARGGCTSWYYDKSGHIVAWPWTYERFERDMQAPDLNDFELR